MFLKWSAVRSFKVQLAPYQRHTAHTQPQIRFIVSFISGNEKPQICLKQDNGLCSESEI